MFLYHGPNALFNCKRYVMLAAGARGGPPLPSVKLKPDACSMNNLPRTPSWRVPFTCQLTKSGFLKMYKADEPSENELKRSQTNLKSW